MTNSIKKLYAIFLLLLLQQLAFAQKEKIDSLKALLPKTKSDSAKLSIYSTILELCDAKDNLLYLNPALDLVSKLLSKPYTDIERERFFSEERLLISALPLYYTQRDSTNWQKVFGYTDQRLKAIEQTGNQKRAAEFLFQIAYLALDHKKDSALFYATMQKSIDLSVKNKDKELLSYSYLYIFSFSKSAGNYAKAFEAVQNTISYSKKFDYPKGVAQALVQLADIYRDFGEYNQAKENYQSALSIIQKEKDTSEIFNVLAALGGFYYKQHNSAKALEYYNQLLDIYKKQPQSEQSIASVYKWMGLVYNDANDYKNALDYFEKSRLQFTAENNIYDMAGVLNEIGSMYNKQKDFNKALFYHLRTISIADSLNIPSIKPKWQYLLAQDYFGLKNYDKAKEVNDVALAKYKRMWYDTKITSDFEQLAMQIDSARGDWRGAFEHYKEYASWNDKLKGDEIKKQAQKEQFQNEIDKQKQEQDKKDAVAKRTRNLQYLLIGAFVLLGIFLFFGYQRKNRDKQKIEKAYGELKSTQAQLIQSEKMASLGELTAGIAHEIQNPLNFVNNFSEVSNELIDEMNVELDKGDIEEAKAIAADVKQNLEKINHHGKRADAIVKGMLQHSRSSSGQKEPTDINALCDEYLRFSYHGLRAKDKSFNATIKTDFDESIGKINIIPQDIGRVILNLLTNAFYAVDEKLKSCQAELVEAVYEPTVSVNTKKVGNKIEINVTDNGNGIPQSIVDKIFQPFFTTKPTGQGTGLGLSLSYDIVKAHGGELKVETAEGKGSEFVLSLAIS